MSGGTRTARQDGRAIDQLRPVSFGRDYTVMAPGSVLVTFGQTKVLCTASVEERVPPWMRGTGRGWVTAEYSMLPGSTPERASREAAKGKQSGRTQEIQRLIARRCVRCATWSHSAKCRSRWTAMRCRPTVGPGRPPSAVPMSRCTTRAPGWSRRGRSARTRSPTRWRLSRSASSTVSRCSTFRTSEDSRAEVDMNVVMTGAGRFVEVQGTAEGMAFTPERAGHPARAGRGGHQGVDGLAGRRAGRTPTAAVSGDGPLRLVLASANPDKVKEIAAVLSAALPVTLVPRPGEVPEVVEDGETLLENARLKARALVAATGTAAVADDTGLEVDALGGAPGVASARYAGEDATYADNVAKLLRELAALGDGGGTRRARFRTVALAAFPDGTEVWAEGAVEGTIATAGRGRNGFGYDPVFVPDGAAGRTFAEMGAEEKDAVSHRGRAFRALAERLSQTTLQS